MNRTFCVLAALLLACLVCAAPAPEPSLPGWKPVDPDNDCKISRGKDSLTIEMPGGDHDYDTARKRLNAPRLVRELEGDFEIQMRVRIDSRPSVKSTVKDQPSHVSAGFLVIPPETYSVRFIHLQYGVAGEGAGADGYASQLNRDVKGGAANFIWDKRRSDWPFKEKPEYVYLRLERWCGALWHRISPDGESWVSVGGGGYVGLPSKLKVGLIACSTSSEPSKVLFDQIKLTRGNKIERWDFVSGWGKPVDPDKDCKIQRDKDTLAIDVPGKYHDYDPIRKHFNAPQLLSDLEGNFDLQVRVRIDSRPSAQSTVEGQPSYISAGFLLIYPEGDRPICDRMEFAVSQRGKDSTPKGMEADGCAVIKDWILKKERKANRVEWDSGTPELSRNDVWDRRWQKWPMPKKAEYAYLRLEQREDWYCFYISPDGEKWTPLHYQRSLPAKRKVGLLACSTSTEPFKVHFDQIKLWRGKKKER